MSRDTVTLRDLYEAIGLLETKINTKFEKLEERVDKQEGFQNRLIGMGAAVSVFISGLISLLWNKLFGKQ